MPDDDAETLRARLRAAEAQVKELQDTLRRQGHNGAAAGDTHAHSGTPPTHRSSTIVCDSARLGAAPGDGGGSDKHSIDRRLTRAAAAATSTAGRCRFTTAWGALCNWPLSTRYTKVMCMHNLHCVFALA